MRKSGILFSIIGAILFVASCPATAQTDTRTRVMQSGTWALDTIVDPFRGTYPVVAYLPAGTVVFESKPGSLRGYDAVLTQYGYWVQISSRRDGPVLLPIEQITQSLPANAILVHRSILCLSQTDRIIEPDELCTYGTIKLPVGKGWVFSFEESQRPGWVDLTARLDSETQRELNERGWDVTEAAFEVKYDDLISLEKRGFITLLNRELPRVTFDNESVSAVYLECGTKTISKRALESSISATASVEAKASFWSWLSAKAGFSADWERSEGNTVEVTIDTTDKSFLFYNIEYYDTEQDSKKFIYIEKQFECTAGPQNRPGDRIHSVIFEIDSGSGVDRDVFSFEENNRYMIVTEGILRRMGRPVFLSTNSEAIHGAVLERVISDWKIEEIGLAHFILSHLNYSCSNNAREACEEATLFPDE